MMLKILILMAAVMGLSTVAFATGEKSPNDYECGPVADQSAAKKPVADDVVVPDAPKATKAGVAERVPPPPPAAH